MRIRTGYTNVYRIGAWSGVAVVITHFTHPHWHRYVMDYFNSAFTPSYEEFKSQKDVQWKHALAQWNLFESPTIRNFGIMPQSRLEKWMAQGGTRWDEPHPYEEACDEFIAYSEQSGIDPGRHTFDTIKKMVDAYYPIDLDSNPDETKQIKKPTVQWVYPNNIEKVMKEEENKPRPNSLGRLLWYIPGYQDWNEELKKQARQEEEEIFTNKTTEEREKIFDELDSIKDRALSELDSFMPLLAYRWDRKLKLFYYLSNSKTDHISDLLKKEGGIKQIFIESGVINESYDPSLNNVNDPKDQI